MYLILHKLSLLLRLVPLSVQVERKTSRNGLKSVLDHVVNDVDYTIITRRDSDDAVVMSLDHYNSLIETVHLLKSPANAAHLSRSIEQFRTAQVIEREILND